MRVANTDGTAAHHSSYTMTQRSSHIGRRNFRHICVICMGASIALITVACARVAPAPDKISVEVLRVSESDLTLRLDNETGRPVSIRGGRTWSFAIGVWPGDSGFECGSTPTSAMNEDPIGFADGNPSTFEIAPGKGARLVIATRFPQRYKGGRCSLTVRLADGAMIGPYTFTP